MHKTRVITSTLGYPQKNRTESEDYEGVQTYMDMKDGSLIAVQPNKIPWLLLLFYERQMQIVCSQANKREVQT